MVCSSNVSESIYSEHTTSSWVKQPHVRVRSAAVLGARNVEGGKEEHAVFSRGGMWSGMCQEVLGTFFGINWTVIQFTDPHRYVYAIYILNGRRILPAYPRMTLPRALLLPKPTSRTTCRSYIWSNSALDIVPTTYYTVRVCLLRVPSTAQSRLVRDPHGTQYPIRTARWSI